MDEAGVRWWPILGSVYGMVAVKLSSWPDFLNTHYDIITRQALHTIAGALT